MMLGYLLARAGVQTLVLEKHKDFLRDFRGDTVHPSTLQAMVDLGLIDAFLKRPHSELHTIGLEIDGQTRQIVDFDHLPVERRFVAFMPQWEFLDFLVEEGRQLPALTVWMQAKASELIEDNDGIVGVRGRMGEDAFEVRADLTIGADGRGSSLRDQARFKVCDLGAPIDVFWFRISRDQAEGDQLLGRINHGHFIITIDRGDYWQCAFVIPKGGAQKARLEGIEVFRRNVAEAAPFLGPKLSELKDFDHDLKLRTVTVDRLNRWSKAGLLFIGDAAHAMSPIGGVGINLEVQDAIAAANLLAASLAKGERLNERQLDAVRRRRLFATKIVQGFQVLAQNRLFNPDEESGRATINPGPIKFVSRSPLLRRLVARMIGLGVRLERVRSLKI